jgi:type I restriction enzyme, S subunit
VKDLPAGWRWVPVEELAAPDRSGVVIGPFGSNLKVSDYRDSGVPLVFVRNIRSGDFRGERRFVSPRKAAELSGHQAVQGDVLITKMGDPPGDAVVYRSADPAVITADCIRIRPGEEVLPEYLAYSFGSPAVRDQVLAITRGVAQKKVSLDRFRKGVLIPTPPVSKQRRIVEILEDHLSRLDAAADQVAAAQQRLESWKRLSLDVLVRSEANELGQLGELLARVEAGRSFGGSAPPAGLDEWGIIKVSAMTWGTFKAEENKAVPADKVDPRFEIQPGDVLVSRANTTDYVGAPVLVTTTRSRLLLSDKSLRLVPKAGIDPSWLATVLAARSTRSQVSSRATGTKDSMRNISQSSLLSVEVPLADAQQQRAVVDRAAVIEDRAMHLHAELSKTLIRGETLRRALLAAAFSGRLA